MTRILTFVALALVLVGCGGNGVDRPAAAAPYADAVIDRFISSCLRADGGTVAKCACVLDRYREVRTEQEFVQSVFGNPSEFRNNIYRSCGIAANVSAIVASPPNTRTTAAGSTLPTGAALPAGVAAPPATSTAPTVRQATDVEACVQQGLVAAQAASGGGSVSLSVLDRIRAGCGG